jgi:hypothetical protein
MAVAGLSIPSIGILAELDPSRAATTGVRSCVRMASACKKPGAPG